MSTYFLFHAFYSRGRGFGRDNRRKKKKTEESKGDLKKECDTGTAGKARLETGGFWNGGGPGTGQLAEMTCRQLHLRQGRGMLGDRRGREPAWASSVSGSMETHHPSAPGEGTQHWCFNLFSEHENTCSVLHRQPGDDRNGVDHIIIIQK